MYQIIIVAHGSMSDGLVDAAELIIGGTEHIVTFNLKQGDDVQALGNQMTALLEEREEGKGALILTDLVGASPYNQALIAVDSLSAEKQADCYVLSGANLPMLLEALVLKDYDLTMEAAVREIMYAAQKSLVVDPELPEEE